LRGVLFCPAFVPERFCVFKCVDIQVIPSGDFIPGLMQLSVMAPAERRGELIADFTAQGSWLSKAQVVRIRRLLEAIQATERYCVTFGVHT
jgi:hypothetical protein